MTSSPGAFVLRVYWNYVAAFFLKKVSLRDVRVTLVVKVLVQMWSFIILSNACKVIDLVNLSFTYAASYVPL